MTERTNNDSTLSLTADIVGAYVSKNSLPAAALTDLISQIHQSLSTLSSGRAIEASVPLAPAVAIKKSVTPDYIISLEDGRKFKIDEATPWAPRHDAGRVPGEVGPSEGLPDGRPELRSPAL